MDSKGQNKIIPIHTNYYKRIAFISTVAIIVFLLIKAYYRIFNPFPYISKQKINFFGFHEHTKLSEYDPILGWKGVPNGEDSLIDDNSNILIKYNSMGFRDADSSVHMVLIPLYLIYLCLGAYILWAIRSSAQRPQEK